MSDYKYNVSMITPTVTYPVLELLGEERPDEFHHSIKHWSDVVLIKTLVAGGETFLKQSKASYGGCVKSLI